MYSKRIELLMQLKERIEEKGVISDVYMDPGDDGNCQFCAVGHLMALTGIEPGDIQEVNGDNVDSLSGRYLNPITSAGITFEELQELQIINDDLMDHRKEGVLSYIDTLIQKRETNKSIYLVLVDEEFVRDVQIATVPEADHMSDDWIDVKGPFSLGTFEAESIEKALEYAAIQNHLAAETLTAYELKGE